MRTPAGAVRFGSRLFQSVRQPSLTVRVLIRLPTFHGLGLYRSLHDAAPALGPAQVSVTARAGPNLVNHIQGKHKRGHRHERKQHRLERPFSRQPDRASRYAVPRLGRVALYDTLELTSLPSRALFLARTQSSRSPNAVTRRPAGQRPTQRRVAQILTGAVWTSIQAAPTAGLGRRWRLDREARIER